ncbi:hypothetical protein NDU88_004306 [Pleurodeles waltl]|uniref:Uncharacterized protein n=1 Tax=Pleurodeles waltl TaxID=8319 RepID=A0AAV7W4W8_PLEWA|nr:hypothetical protein NDU88_004306 [Pleurodeles waltl]
MASLLPESLEAQLVGPRTVHGGRNYGQRTEGVRVTIRGKTVTQRARGGLRTPQLPVTGRMSLPVHAWDGGQSARVVLSSGGSRWLPCGVGSLGVQWYLFDEVVL